MQYRNSGPRYLRTFYLQFSLFVAQENISNLIICSLALANLLFIKEIGL